MIKPISTRYAGCEFRSRLEARWAVFFDALAIEWRYEPEGFETPAGRYLPDFYLPQSMRWIEIKGGSFTRRDRERAAHFAESRWQVGEGYRLLQGDIPREATAGPENRGMLRAITWWQAAVPIIPEAIPGGPLSLHDLAKPRPEGWGAPLPIRAGPGELLEWGALRDFGTTGWALVARVPEVNVALSAARSARFEFGRSGGRPE